MGAGQCLATWLCATAAWKWSEAQTVKTRFIRSWLIAFCAMFATDLCWSWYVAAVRDADALRASAWAVALFLLGAVAILGYTRDRWLLLPASAGAFAGTYLGVILQ